MQIVFVHGAFVRDGAWWWHPVAELVERSTGVRSVAVALPSCGESAGGRPAGLREDAAALRETLDAAGSAVVVAHSYGGTVAAEGAGHPAVHHLVYISSFLPDVGECQSDLVAGGADPVPVRPNPDGTVSVDADDRPAFDLRFLHDVADPELVAQAHARLAPQWPAAFGTPTTAAAWQSIESTYLLCAADHSTPPQLQREHARRATHAHELDTGHHPFLSRPDLVAGHLAAIVQRD